MERDDLAVRVAESAPERGGRAAAGVAEWAARVLPRAHAGAMHVAVALEAEPGDVGGTEDDGGGNLDES